MWNWPYHPKFVTYVNDIANCTKADILSFSDDTSLFVNNSNITEQ